MGFQGITGAEGIRMAILPNLKMYDSVLKEGLEADDARKKAEAETVIMALLACLSRCAVGGGDAMANGDGSTSAEVEGKVVDKIGEVLGRRVVQSGQPKLIKAVLDTNYDF